MKSKNIYILIVLIHLIFTQNSFSQELFLSDEVKLEDALVLSDKENKPIFLLIYANWCSHCREMKKEVFEDKEVKDFLLSNYIVLQKEIGNEEGAELQKRFEVITFPTMIILDKDENILYKYASKLKKNDFLKEFNVALIKEKQLPFLKSDFENNPSNANKCLNFLTTLKKGSPRTKLSPFAHQYLATQSEAKLLTNASWRVITNGVTDIDSKEFQFVLKNRERFEILTSPKRVENKIVNISKELLNPIVEKREFDEYYEKRKIVERINLKYSDSVLYSYDIEVASLQNKLDMFAPKAEILMKEYYWNDASKLKLLLDVYANRVQEIQALKSAQKYADRLCELSNIYDNNLIAAKIYLKSKDKKKSMQYAKQAKAFRTELGFDTQEIEDFIKTIK